MNNCVAVSCLSCLCVYVGLIPGKVHPQLILSVSGTLECIARLVQDAVCAVVAPPAPAPAVSLGSTPPLALSHVVDALPFLVPLLTSMLRDGQAPGDAQDSANPSTPRVRGAPR